jgi:hypothetical protein
MTDFFADLERQLVHATAERPQRLRRARARRGALLATVLLAVLACGAGLASALSGDGSDGGTARPAGLTGTTATAVAPAPTQTTLAGHPFTVAVLNGTRIPGLARGVATRLQNAKFKIGNVTNATDQTRAETEVAYAPGYNVEAGQVAGAIGLQDFTLIPIDAGSRAIAGRIPKVVVLVGSDQNTAP